MRVFINTHYLTAYAIDSAGVVLKNWAELDVATLENRAHYLALVRGYSTVEFTYSSERC